MTAATGTVPGSPLRWPTGARVSSGTGSEGWSEGLAWCGESEAIALTDGNGLRLYVGGREGLSCRLISGPSPLDLAEESGRPPLEGSQRTAPLLCLRHSDAGDMLRLGLRVLR